MFKLFNDLYKYQSYFIDNSNFLDLLDPFIGELEGMRLSVSSVAVKEFWKPLEVEVFHNEGTVDLPDLSIWRLGLVVMTKRAYESLVSLLSPFGEFLPVKLLGETGYLYHCTNIRQFSDSEVTYRMHGDIFAGVSSLKFSEGFNDHCVTGIYKVCSDTYFSKEVAMVIKEQNLTGLLLSDDLTLMAPY